MKPIAIGLSVALTASTMWWHPINAQTLEERKVDVINQIGQAEKLGTLTSQEAKELRTEAEKISSRKTELEQKRGRLTVNEKENLESQFKQLCQRLRKEEALSADNTGRNLGDNRNDSPTPQVQSARKEDLAITQELRKRLVNDKQLSADAQNVKIVTINGVTVLRGVANSPEEKQKIYAEARQCVGSENVLDEITVK